MKSLPRAMFISHGGGPLPLLGDPGHKHMVTCLQDIAADIPRPDAILVISAHWEEKVPTLTAHPNPALIYDYYGFPPESYDIQYPCDGKPELATEIYRMLGEQKIDARLDHTRGLDHGVFVPLKIMYPKADIPCVQLSLVNTLDAALHIRIGSALQGVVNKNVLVIGSGFSFHNMRAFFAPTDAESYRLNESFENWLHDVCGNRNLSEEKRQELLTHWADAPGARYCHPREEHLLPLHVCYGVSQSPCTKIYNLDILGKRSSMCVW